MKATLRHIYFCRTANMSWSTCVVIKQIQSKQHRCTPWALHDHTVNRRSELHGSAVACRGRSSETPLLLWARCDISTLWKMWNYSAIPQQGEISNFKYCGGYRVYGGTCVQVMFDAKMICRLENNARPHDVKTLTNEAGWHIYALVNCVMNENVRISINI